MIHPFAKIPRTQQRWLFFLFSALTVGIGLMMVVIGKPLNSPSSPLGIVSYEFSWTVAGARDILSNWGANAQVRAGFLQGLDYLFLVIYSQMFAIACLTAGQRLELRRWPWSNWGNRLAWGMWLAALFDAIENLALVIMLFGIITDPWPMLAGLCAMVKFSLLAIGLAYSSIGWAAGWVQPPPR